MQAYWVQHRRPVENYGVAILRKPWLYSVAVGIRLTADSALMHGGCSQVGKSMLTSRVWFVLTILAGCPDQYTIMRDEAKGGFGAYGAFNPNTQRMEKLSNSPHDGFQGLWPMAWPEEGGGGDFNTRISENELFERMCAWDDAGYIIAAGTRPGSDTNSTDGIVDGHAYTVLDCENDVCGHEGIDLIKVRNPWCQPVLSAFIRVTHFYLCQGDLVNLNVGCGMMMVQVQSEIIHYDEYYMQYLLPLLSSHAKFGGPIYVVFYRLGSVS